ncbi:MAG: DUF4124 domain-containing protein, partial [Gammaproteobacteria bacterium]
MFILVPPVSHAQLYKWVDDEGVTQYSERPPPDRTEVEIVDIQVTPADEAAIREMKSQLNKAD